MYIARVVVLGILFVQTTLTLDGLAQENPTALSDRRVDKSGFVPQLELIGPPKVEWQFTSEPNDQGRVAGLSDAASAAGMVFFGDDFGVLRAFTAKQGVKVWSHEHGERVFHPPMSDGERVYMMTRKGISALAVDSGEVLWFHALEKGGGRCLAAGDPSTLYCAGSDGTMYAFDGATGNQRWTASLTDDAPEDPPGFDGASARLTDTAARPTGIALDAETVFQTVFDQCRVVAFHRTTGDKRWSFQTGGWVYGDPAVDDKQVYLGSQDKKLYCLDKHNGRLLWNFATGSRIESGPAVNDTCVFIPSCDGHVYCLDKSSGALKWKFATDGVPLGKSAIYSAPIVSHDSLYFAASDGNLYAVNSESGELRWKITPSPASALYTSPATDGVRLFIKSRPTDDNVGINAVFAISSTQQFP